MSIIIAAIIVAPVCLFLGYVYGTWTHGGTVKLWRFVIGQDNLLRKFGFTRGKSEPIERSEK